MTTGIRPVFAVAAVLIFDIALAHAAEPVLDEASRLQALRLAFPGARISAVPAKTNEEIGPVTDPIGRVVAEMQNALGPEPEYEVIGPIATAEEAAATDIRPAKEQWASDKRRLRMRLYRWNRTDDQQSPLHLAVLNYTFTDVIAARCCHAMGRLVLLSSAVDRVLDSFEVKPHAFSIFTSIRFIDVGSRGEKLMIGADYSGVSSIGVQSVVFEILNNKVNPILSVDTIVLYEAELKKADVHTLTFDGHRTLLENGEQFFFVKETYVENGNVLDKPLTTTVSFPVGTGIPLDWR